ncbi:MAG: efflux RND transporter periplasmic adaptor subunit [Burkholderiaceae bacterium]|nr:efflux RND transporter periplasmic adaptor subunit [Ideonella sp.]MCC7286408.1 efflux RND transporter periplasmic adaptor subunit [Burkholderiaceae bacterium]
MKRPRAIVAALAAALVLVAAAGAIIVRAGRAVAVPIAEAALGQVSIQVSGPGTVQARIPVTLSARITATVRRLDADIGDAVQRGQLLALLDDRDLAARRGVVGGQREALARNVVAAAAAVAKAQADLELAQSKQRRDAELLRTGFVSPSVLDASEAAQRAAQANLDSARAAQAAREAEAHALTQEVRYSDTVLSYTRVVAPMDGVIIQRQVEVGATVVAGTPIYRLVDPKTLWVAMRVDESVVGRVEVGQPAHIRLRTGDELAGKVARIARQSDAATRELEVNVAFDAPPARFAIDQEAQVAIDTGTVSGIVVPLPALTRDPEGRQGVLVVEDGRARFRPVATGAADRARVLVASGLASGERVVARAEGVKVNARVRALELAGG